MSQEREGGLIKAGNFKQSGQEVITPPSHSCFFLLLFL